MSGALPRLFSGEVNFAKAENEFVHSHRRKGAMKRKISYA